ncbi:lantibiotic dehydratase [Actinophytocola sp. NPDC049390]|uniref:lantibiotic dehydratase n=1 Tax=Actinophytocola sp. NPDC049390 TaxID=3363894 RepID=UPI0037909135
MTHLVPLGDTGWTVWRDVLLRSTGFPVAGLDRFTAPEAAAAADACNAGDQPAELFDKVFTEALRAGAVAIGDVAADPLLREAVAWQNPAVLSTLDKLVAGGPDTRRTVRRRDREKALLRYWQRYCAKSETIGFFGPVSWGTVDPAAPTTVRVGPELVRDRAVFFEAWALIEYGDALAADLAVRRWWPPVPRPHVTVEGRWLRTPLADPVELSAADAQLLSRCDGHTPAHQVVAGVGRGEQDGYLLLDRLVDRGLLHWDAHLPLSHDAETVLRERIAAIGDDEVRARVAAGFDRLCAARDAATTDPTTLSTVDAEFTAVTGRAATRRDGQMYAGRTLTYLDTTRDADLVVGGGLLTTMAAPLTIVLRAARWLSARFGAACEQIAADLHAAQPGPVHLSDLWYPVQDELFDTANGPSAGIGAEFTARWSRLFRLAEHPGAAEIRLTAADLAAESEQLFAAPGPGWPSARVHSVDLQVCAAEVADLDDPATLLVLGELHPAYNPFDSALFSPWHPDQQALRAAHHAEFGPRTRMLYPDDAPRNTGRARHGLNTPGDCELGVVDARGAGPHLVPATSILVEDRDGELTAVLPDGRTWPLVEAFGHVLTVVLLDSFKLVGPAATSPRIVLDQLVVARRTWRTTVAATGLADVTGERDRFLATRAFRQRLGLPERVFVKLGTETKPTYVDLAGPGFVQVLCTMLRTARQSGPDVPVTITEQLPSTADSWLPDAHGGRYVSELRFQLTDPAQYSPSGARR